jgi:uracil-DNA glycosylase
LDRLYRDVDAGAQLFRLSVSDMRGLPIAFGARILLPTIHPAYRLRLPDPTAKDAETRAFANDLRQAAVLAHEGRLGK